jgi:hypothetical protein
MRSAASTWRPISSTGGARLAVQAPTSQTVALLPAWSTELTEPGQAVL